MTRIITAEQERRHYERLVALAQFTRETSIKANARWVLALAVGNGAALAALSARLVSGPSEAVAALLMPSCWLFALGLLAAGGVSVVSAYRWEVAAQDYGRTEEDYHAGKPYGTTYEKVVNKVWFWVEASFEALAACCFAAGLLYPMAVLCHRYLTSGSGFYP